MAEMAFQAQEKQQHARVDEIRQAAEIPPDQVIQGEVVNVAAFGQVAQHALEASGLDGFQLRLHGVQVGGQ